MFCSLFDIICSEIVFVIDSICAGYMVFKITTAT